MYTRAVKGNYKSGYAPLVKNILKYNEDKIKKAGWISGEALFKEMNATFKDNRTVDNTKNMLEFVRKAMNTASIGTKESIFRHNLGAILEESWTKDKLDSFLKDNNIQESDLAFYFNDWQWNATLKRWEGPQGQWIQVLDVNPDDYQNSEIEYGI